MNSSALVQIENPPVGKSADMTQKKNVLNLIKVTLKYHYILRVSKIPKISENHVSRLNTLELDLPLPGKLMSSNSISRASINKLLYS